MPYNFAAVNFHTKKLCSRISSSEVRFLMQIGRFAFFRPPLGDLGKTYGDHLRLIGLPISINWTFFGKCYGWGATRDYRFKIGDFAPMGAGWPNISGRRAAPTNHSSSQKTRLNVLSSGQIFLSFCHNPRVWQTDIQMDRQTEFSSLDRICIPCSAVKIRTDFSSVLSQSTHLTDRQTDGQTNRWTDTFLATRLPHVQCSAVKMTPCLWMHSRSVCTKTFLIKNRSQISVISGLFFLQKKSAAKFYPSPVKQVGS